MFKAYALCGHGTLCGENAWEERGEDEIFPWDIIDIGVSKKFLRREYEKSKKEEVTPNCRMNCAGCGAAKFQTGVCMEER